MRLALTCQLADERAGAEPDNDIARRFAGGVRVLFLDALVLPEGHSLFDGGADAASIALTARKRQAEASWTL